MSLYYELKKKFGLPDADAFDYTSQYSLVPIARTTDEDATSLAMRIADPLWMLGRQWQFGEFKGEDNGSPICVATYFDKQNVEFYSCKNHTERKALGTLPPEAKIEAVALAKNPKLLDLKSKVRIGQRFEKIVNKVLGTQAITIILSLIHI